MRAGRIILFCCCAAACLHGSPRAQADGVILNGVSPLTVGRGGTNIAHWDNGSILHDNPAAMGFIGGGSMFELGITTLTPDFQYGDSDSASRGQHTVYMLPEFAYIRRRACSPWTFGVGAFGSAGFGGTYTLEGPPSYPGPQRYDSFGSLTKVLAGAAYQATDCLSFGAAVGGAYTMAQLEGPYTLQGPSLPGIPTLLDLDTDGIAFVWSAGLFYRLSPCTTVGLAYQSESHFHTNGTTEALGPLGATEFDTEMEITWPRSLGLGVRHEWDRCRTVSADVIWFDWSAAFDEFGIDLTNSTNGAYPDIEEEFPLDWRDTVSLRFGFEQDLGCDRVLRLGYVYHRNPIPESTITPYIPAALEHAFSIGYGWMTHGWNVNVSYMYTIGSTVEVDTHGFLGGDFDDSTHRSQTHAAGINFIRLW